VRLLDRGAHLLGAELGSEEFGVQLPVHIMKGSHSLCEIGGRIFLALQLVSKALSVFWRARRDVKAHKRRSQGRSHSAGGVGRRCNRHAQREVFYDSLYGKPPVH